MKRHYSLQGSWLLLGGDTYPLRDQLKLLGARWRGADKMWILSAENPEKILALQNLGFVLSVSAASDKETGPSEKAAQSAQSALSTLSAPKAVFLENEGASALSPKTWSVRQLNVALKAMIERTLPADFWIEGEVSSFKVSKGHCYFDLSDPPGDEDRMRRQASVSCCLWAGRIKILQEKYGELPLGDGVKVRICVAPDWRAEGGRLSLIVEDLDPNHTEGALARARKAIVLELKKRGLFEANRRQFLSPFSLRVALITANESRAHTDFLDELKQSQLAFRLVLLDCHMQGEKTSPEVSQAFSWISARHEEFDCVILTRGGGSRMDLRWFDDLEIGKAIGKCPLPVITAIGHFEDQSIADEISYQSLKTPTAAASYLSNRIQSAYSDLASALESQAKVTSKRLARIRGLLEVSKENLASAARRRLQREQRSHGDWESRLRLTRRQTQSPLKRGYALLKRLNSDEPLTPSKILQESPGQVLIQMWETHSNQNLEIVAKILEVRKSPHLSDTGDSQT